MNPRIDFEALHARKIQRKKEFIKEIKLKIKTLERILSQTTVSRIDELEKKNKITSIKLDLLTLRIKLYSNEPKNITN